MRLVTNLLERLRGGVDDPAVAALIAGAGNVPELERRDLDAARERIEAAMRAHEARAAQSGHAERRGMLAVAGASLQRAHSDEWGQSAPLMVLALGLLLVMAVMSIDIGLMLDERRQVQAAADFAALAASQELPSDPLDPQFSAKLATAEAVARDYLARNGYDTTDPEIASTITTNYNGEYNSIEVYVGQPRDWMLGRIFSLDTINVGGRAVAQADTQPRDVVVVLDRSSSMCELTHSGGGCPNPPGDPDGNGVDDWQPFDQMRDAANGFADNFRPFVGGSAFDQLGIVSYSSDAMLELGLTTDYGSGGAYETAIDSMAPDGWTNIGHALYVARTELDANTGRGAAQVIVLLSDGKANRYVSGGTYETGPSFSGCSGGCAAADSDAVAQATLAAQNGAAIYTIGLTSSAGTALLQQIADIGANQGSGGQFFDVDDPDDLDETFTAIANLVGYGLIE